ncbi:unnamed protein product [Cuscuta epithymum]|uniref:Uncharacterized protein n=1 Tax=Cuscuta epithymum TaxID=186058 RepID=A0AAV0FVM8_9ASTE|nr:unnamed protein product [Cuscuta epithymum]
MIEGKSYFRIPAHDNIFETLNVVFHDDWSNGIQMYHLKLMRSGNVITSTLWGILVDNLLTYRKTSSGPIIMILQCCKDKNTKGSSSFRPLDSTFQGDIDNDTMPLVTIASLTRMEEDKRHWVLAHIGSIDSHREWCYISCIR